MKRQLLRFLPLIILLIGVGGFMGLVSTRSGWKSVLVSLAHQLLNIAESIAAPERRVLPDLGPLVETLAAPAQTLQIVVDAQGSVRPADEIDLVSQVPGVVVWKAPQLETGGFFARGDVLLRIDPRDFELAMISAEAAVARARYQLDLAQEEAAVASQEWELVRSLDTEPTDLLLRLPQVRAAEADLLAAEAGLSEARLRLERTQIRAPFDGRVRETGLDVGQYVAANQSVSRVYGIERAEIVVAVPHKDMAWLEIPLLLPEMAIASLSSEKTGTDIARLTESGGPRPSPPPTTAPQARVFAEFAGRRHAWDGFVTRTAAELDARSRMMRLVVEVDTPYAQGGDSDTPLLVGMFVDVKIFGKSVDGVRVLPRVALREGNIVWVADREGTLHLRPAQVLHVRDERVVVRLDLSDDERIVVSQLSGVTDGMKVRLDDGESRS